MRFLLLTIALSFLLAMHTPQPADPDDEYAEVVEKLSAYIRYEMDDKAVPAFSIALTDAHQTLWAGGFGMAKPEVPATGETVYRVASISKLFTALAIMQQVEQGKLNLDVPITQYVPDITFENAFDFPITLRHIHAHRSGIIREPPVGHYFDPTEPALEKTAQSLKGTPIIYEPGTRTKYSNAAVSLAGYLLQRIEGRPFENIIQTQILNPLGMKSSSFSPRPDLRKRLAKGQMWGYDGRKFEAPVFELGIGPAANLYTTVTDLCRFMRMLIAGGLAPDGTRLIQKSTLEQMWTPQFTNEKAGFGIGFYISEFKGHRRVQHNGVMYGYASRVYALPEAGLGVVAVATLDATNSVVDRIAEYALSLMLAHRAGYPLPNFPRTTPLSRRRAKLWAGRYQNEEGRYFDLIERQGRLLYDNGTTLLNLNTIGDTLIVDDRLSYGFQLRPIVKHLKRGGENQRIQGVICAGSLYERIEAPHPPSVPAHFTGLIGEYGWDHNTLYILEEEGQRYALIEWFFKYPLTQITPDTYAFPDYGLYMGEKLYFKRDANRRATEVEAASVVWKRRNIEPEAGHTFTIEPIRPMASLRDEALQATPPEEAGPFHETEWVALTDLDPTIKLDIRYATTNNFTGHVFYDEPLAFMQSPAAEALLEVHQRLKKQGFGLWVYDAYRPWYVTKMFWDATPASLKHFVANPQNGSRHNRGCAVDLTLYDLATGQPVDMVSGYDEFTERAYADYPGGTGRQRWHRAILRQAMEQEGFMVYPFEWWHFDFRNWREYPILNVTFNQID